MEKSNNFVFMAVEDSFEELSMDLLSTEDSVEDLFATKETTETTETSGQINPEELFAQKPVEEGSKDSPEKVDKDGNTEESTNGEDPLEKEGSPSAISSILTALKQDGVLPDVDETKLLNAKTPEDFAEIIELQVAARLSESERRVKEALEVGVEPDEVKNYEGVITYLDSLTEDAIIAETVEGEELRKRLIYRDLLNKGFKPERAEKEVEKSFTAGTDVEDAKSALEGNKEFYTKEYDSIIKQKKAEADSLRKKQQDEKAALAKKTLETKEPLPGVEVDLVTRKKTLDNMTKLTEKDANGNPITVVQKFIADNPVDAQYFLSLFYTLTNGFKTVDKVIAKKVTTATQAALANLDKSLRQSSGVIDSGNPLFSRDDNSKSIRLDV